MEQQKKNSQTNKQTKQTKKEATNKQTNRQTDKRTNKQTKQSQVHRFSPQNCVEFLFLDLCLPRLPRPASASRLRVTPSLSSHTIFVIPSFTHHLSHNLITHYLSHTSLSHTIFHTQLCRTSSFTHIFVTHHLSHTSLHLCFGTFPWQAWHF